ncbi:protein hook homolog isoform X2 [Trifolium pratense]|uniref:protein hook homolog isoform X2 n=1 Tax=Trifolium pratense TaxID=57577 RepID=UPI001E68FDCE|nr:protein hook homolog isoform X2 [Trifolium pratense]
MVNLIRKSSQEAPSNNSPNTLLMNAERKRPRLEVSSSPLVQIVGNNQPNSSEGRDEMWTSFVPKINGSGDGDATSIWDDHFPLRELIDKHFIQKEKVEELDLERVLQTSLAESVRSNFRLRVLAGKFRDMEKKNKTYVAEISELQKKLSENEKNYAGEVNELKKKMSEYGKNMAEMTSLKDELNKLKKSLEESSVEKSQLVGREKDLMEENSNLKTKLSIEEDAHKLVVDKLKAEIEELKGENKLQYKAGYDKARSQVLIFTTRLNVD